MVCLWRLFRLPFQYLLEAEHLVAVLGGLGKVELLGSLLHEFAGASNALLELATRHVGHDGIGSDREAPLVSPKGGGGRHRGWRLPLLGG